jgi:predicted lipid-binding transport protein (Tim44 family)
MKSKLLQKKSSGLQPGEVVNGQQEKTEDSSEPWTHTKPHTTQSTWQLTPRPAS